LPVHFSTLIQPISLLVHFSTLIQPISLLLQFFAMSMVQVNIILCALSYVQVLH